MCDGTVDLAKKVYEYVSIKESKIGRTELKIWFRLVNVLLSYLAAVIC